MYDTTGCARTLFQRSSAISVMVKPHPRSSPLRRKDPVDGPILANASGLSRTRAAHHLPDLPSTGRLVTGSGVRQRRLNTLHWCRTRCCLFSTLPGGRAGSPRACFPVSLKDTYTGLKIAKYQAGVSESELASSTRPFPFRFARYNAASARLIRSLSVSSKPHSSIPALKVHRG
jgi:hypothetical protein